MQGVAKSRSSWRLLLVEADSSACDALVSAFADEGFSVGLAISYGAACRVSSWHPPDIAVVDVDSLHLDGLALVRWLRKSLDTPMVVLSARDSLDEIASGYRAGADHYVTKPFTIVELIWRVRALLRRACSDAGEVIVCGDLVVDMASHRASRGGEWIELTPTEFKLLAVLSRHSGQTLTHDQLLSHTWGDAVQRDARLVAKHLSALRRKLDAHGPTQITTVHGVGYRLENGMRAGVSSERQSRNRSFSRGASRI